MFDTLGFNGPKPLAVVFFREKNDDESKYKKICYEEQDLIDLYNVFKTPGSFYSKLIPSVQMVGDIENE